MTHRFRWRKNREHLYGRLCRIVARGKINSVLLEFENGEQQVCSRWAIERIDRRFK